MTQFPGSDDENNKQISWPCLTGPSYRSRPAFSPDSESLAIVELVNSAYLVRILDTLTGEERLRFEICGKLRHLESCQIDFASDGDLVTLSYDGQLNIWDPITGALLQTADVAFGQTCYTGFRSFAAGTCFSQLSQGTYAIKCCDNELRV